MFITRATTLVDSARLDPAGFVAGESLGRHAGRIWRRNISSASAAVRWFFAVGAIALLGWADFAAGSAETFSILYLVPIAFAAWFIRASAGVVLAVLSVLVWLLVEYSLG